jgi:ribonuclease P protein component
MLKKINRGLTRKDFEKSREVGRLIHGNYFSVSVMDEGGHAGPPVQIGFVISKKISKRAVDRNRIKRLLCEVMKDKLPEGLKIIILVRKNILEAKIEDIKKSWEMVYEKISSENTDRL